MVGSSSRLDIEYDSHFLNAVNMNVSCVETAAAVYRTVGTAVDVTEPIVVVFVTPHQNSFNPFEKTDRTMNCSITCFQDLDTRRPKIHINPGDKYPKISSNIGMGAA